MARKVVGVGSVGTRCWIILLTGRDDDDPLLLQVKEAPPSVYAEYLGASRYENQGQRVVAGQRLRDVIDHTLALVRQCGGPAGDDRLSRRRRHVAFRRA